MHGVDGMLLLLTGGELVWDAIRNDFDWTQTTALPRSFAGCFAEEPRHVDMRWARSETQLDLNNGRFRDQIGEIAAPVHGVPKDQIATLDVREHRRTIRQAIAAGIARVMLTLASIALTVFAISSRASRGRSRTQSAALRESCAERRSGQRAMPGGPRPTRSSLGRMPRTPTRADKREDTPARMPAGTRKTRGQGAGGDAGRGRDNASQANASAAEATQQQHNAEQNADNARAAGLYRTTSAQRGDCALVDRGLKSCAEQWVDRYGAAPRRAGDDVRERQQGRHRRQRHKADAHQRASGQSPSGWLAARHRRAGSSRHDIEGSLDALLPCQPAGRSSSGDSRTDNASARFTLPCGDYGVLQFLDSNTLVVAGDRLEAYRTVDGGATWTHAWTWPPGRSTSIDAFAASPHGIVVADSDRIELLDAFGHNVHSVVAPGLEYARRSCSALRAPTLRWPGHGRQSMDLSNPIRRRRVRDEVRALVSNIPFTPHDPTNGQLLVSDLRFSSDGRQITALVSPFTIPIYRFWVRTGKEVPFGPGKPGEWGPIVPDTPIGLSPNLNDIIQTDTNDPEHGRHRILAVRQLHRCPLGRGVGGILRRRQRHAGRYLRQPPTPDALR